jgi:hypothetical protein
MSATPKYMWTQKDLRIDAWVQAAVIGGLASIVTSAVFGIAVMFGAVILESAFIGTIFVVFFVVVGIVRLVIHVPSPDEQAAMRENDVSCLLAGGRLRGLHPMLIPKKGEVVIDGKCGSSEAHAALQAAIAEANRSKDKP